MALTQLSFEDAWHKSFLIGVHNIPKGFNSLGGLTLLETWIHSTSQLFSFIIGVHNVPQGFTNLGGFDT